MQHRSRTMNRPNLMQAYMAIQPIVFVETFSKLNENGIPTAYQYPNQSGQTF